MQHLEHPEQKALRKGKERDPSAPQPTDLDERLTALRRRTAAQTRPKDRTERDKTASAPTPAPAITLTAPPSQHRSDRSPKMPAASSRNLSSRGTTTQAAGRHTHEADHEDFQRRLKISGSPSSKPSSRPSGSKLYNPDVDPIPSRRHVDSDAMSDDHAPRSADVGRLREDRSSGTRQLFDHRKDDPVRFSVLPRPPQSSPSAKNSAKALNTISASSTSSYAPSIASSAFTLSSTTDASSASSALFDGRQNQSQRTGDSSNNVISDQLKKLYRAITALEARIKQEDTSDDLDDGMASRVMLKGKETNSEEQEKEKWKKQIADHKRLAEYVRGLLEISLAPSVPASLRNIPTKYNIIVRLWTYAFHKILESLRQSSFQSHIAMEHLQEFIYYAYTFYTGLLEEPSLVSFKSGWLEALGDLARYRMAVAAMVSGGVGSSEGLTMQQLSQVMGGSETSERPSSTQSVSDCPAPRIDDSPTPSTGLAAARGLEVEPEKERWRNIAREWYAAGLAEQPGTGKLHHHLGLLSREIDSEELRAVYHYVKSMTTLHPFPTSRESVLPIWSPAAQARRSLPDARASELFILMHGMLFTNIQLDDFQPTLARFIERLDIEGAEEREWIMMGVINITAILEYGRATSVLRKVGMVGAREGSGPQIAAAMRVMAKKAAAGVPGSNPFADERMDIDGETQRAAELAEDGKPTPTEHTAIPVHEGPIELSPAFKFAAQLTFTMLSHVLHKPTRKASQYASSTLNPYITVILTFLATVLKHKPALEVLERSIPWEELSEFFKTIPRKIMIDQGLMDAPGKPSTRMPGGDRERWPVLTSQCTPPLAEDWCIRGMEWVGRKVFERGYWKGGEERKVELEILDMMEQGEASDGMIESDDDDDHRRRKVSASSDLVRRWIRIARSAVLLSGEIDGLSWKEGTREWAIDGALAEKTLRWKEEDRLERENEERRRMGRRWTDDMEVDDEEEAVSEEDSEDNEDDSEDIKLLKARRRHLKSLLRSSRQVQEDSRPSRSGRRVKDNQPLLNIVPGYTVLVLDTNILLSSLSIISSLIETLRWTVVVPLPVIMELDGIRTNASQLGEAAQAAMDYITGHIRSHSLSLKVQTSKGNYLATLNVRSERVDFDSASPTADKSMDDLILKAAIWHDDHWVDRSAFLKGQPALESERQTAVKVVLLSLDRNLRLKARSRQLPAASEKDIASILATAT